MSAIQRPNAMEYTAQILADLDVALDQLAINRQIMFDTKEKVENLEQVVNSKQRELLEEMKRMDLTASGNYGYENRITRFLIDMRRVQLNKVR